jgi:hypothetical protein
MEAWSDRGNEQAPEVTSPQQALYSGEALGAMRDGDVLEKLLVLVKR